MRTRGLVLWTIGLVLFMAILGLCARPVSADDASHARTARTDAHAGTVRCV